MSGFWEWVVGISGASAVLVLVGRALVGHLFSRDLERFKADLKRTTDLELERQKLELQKGAVEHETAFRWLHDKQADAIEELYGKFIKAASAVDQALSTATLVEMFGGGQPALDLPLEEARVGMRDFKEALKGYRPLIQEDLDEILNTAADELDMHLFSVTAYAGNFLIMDETDEKPDIASVRSSEEQLKALEERVVDALRHSFNERA